MAKVEVQSRFAVETERERKGFLVVIEGGDGVGKATQLDLLYKVLSEHPGDFSAWSFPRYDAPLGRVVKRMLAGELADLVKIDPILIAMPYVADQAVMVPYFWEALRRPGYITVCDRFYPSNFAYQAARLPESKRAEFIKQLNRIYFEDLHFPRADLVLFLSVDSEVAKLNLEKQGEALDKNEADVAYQKEVFKVYHSLAAENPNTWVIIECVKDGQMRSPEDIHKEVVSVLKKRRILK